MTLPFDREDTRSVLVLGLGAWGASVAYAASQDVFARISPGAAVALALLAAVAAPAALALDANLCEQASRASAAALCTALLGALLAILAGVGVLLRGPGLSLEAAVGGPFAVLTYFVGPVALGLATALLRRDSGTSVTRSAPAKSPAASPAARRASRTNAPGAGAAGA